MLNIFVSPFLQCRFGWLLQRPCTFLFPCHH